MELLAAVEKRIQDDNIKNIRFEFLDTNAVARSKTIPARHFKSTATSGILFPAGVDIECVETEYAKGQFELVICPTFGIKAADNAATFRTGVKEMAMRNGFVASFMSKPYPKEGGSSGHLNHSLWSLDGKTPKTGDSSRPYGLSEIGEHWIAGLLEHAPALSFLQSPTVNCRDRVKPDTFAPFNATWGVDNRTCAVRLKPVGAHGIYMENRMGSSAGNPYISLAATIAAGIDGSNVSYLFHLQYRLTSHLILLNTFPDTALLPADMEAAFQALKKDEILVSAIGADLVDALESVRRLEMTTFAADSDVEKFELHRRMYFDYV
ncbi:putative lengsin-like [Apostichopus japonicus]|uniref:Lengsin n=1 Tax=Stichopus japonicus TaxID=307972 RepID=A0A2G8L468_STIJA|nr:putative lengsin-like [Apostichopus japonicus]